MKQKTQLFLFFISLLLPFADLIAQTKIKVQETQIPFLIERADNVLYYIRVEVEEESTLNELQIAIDKNTDLAEFKSLKLYYSGTEALQDYDKNRMAPVAYLSAHNPQYTLKANPSYSVLLDEKPLSEQNVLLRANQKLFTGVHFFWVSLEANPEARLTTKFSCLTPTFQLNGKEHKPELLSTAGIEHRMALAVRKAGDDGSSAYRIPGLVTTNKGTLLAVYDVRYNSGVDLQEHVDVGLSRSTDGGRSWEKMRLPLSFGEYGGLPAAQNGVGDPAILVDSYTNTIWVIAAWTHGMGNQRAWWSSHPGLSKEQTAQLVLAKSTDDGKTWSSPINITEQVKDPSWYFLLQGPGRGITMQDGTLVFPIQYIDQERIPNAGVMYSKDRGETWTIHNHARSNTTESQVVELEPGVLMLNMRDNRGGSRAVYTTDDLGRTWTAHPSSRSALQEPVCMASLLAISAADNVLGKDILLFSNPNTTKGRHSMTVKMSLDGGLTWPKEQQILLDEGASWGYSCLTQIDEDTLGILYESSVAHMTFQAISLSDFKVCE